MFHFAVGPILRITYEGWAKPCITEMCKSPYVNQEAHTGVGGGGGDYAGYKSLLIPIRQPLDFFDDAKGSPCYKRECAINRVVLLSRHALSGVMSSTLEKRQTFYELPRLGAPAKFVVLRIIQCQAKKLQATFAF